MSATSKLQPKQPPTTYVGWLPPVHCGRETAWLPLSQSVFQVLSRCLLQRSAKHRSTCHAQLVHCLAGDPSFLITTTCLQALSSRQCIAASNVSLTALAGYWEAQGAELFSATDWLAAPDRELSQQRAERFRALSQYFANLPLSRQLTESALWLRAGGMRTDDSEVQTLVANLGVMRVGVPDLEPGTDLEPGSMEGHLVLGSLADLRRDCESLGERFSQSVEIAKHGLAHRLAYGLSHEINNPLANITSRAQAILKRIEASGELQSDPLRVEADSLRRIVDQAYRAHAMIADLMFYANPPKPTLAWQNVAEVFAPLAQAFSQRIATRGIQFAMRVPDDVADLRVRVDVEMVREAIGALLQNSVDAVNDGGRIELVCRRVEQILEINVADSGPGLTAKQAAIAADPYYSGREAGRGLGLGLSRASRIAQIHGGTLSLQPAIAGCVATFSIAISHD